MAYTTQENIEDKLEAALSQDQADYFTNVLSPAIDAFINQQTETQFGSDTAANVYVNGECSSILVIPTMHTITDLVKVEDDGTETTISTDDYVTYPQGEADKYAIRSRTGTWDEGFENYKVSGKLGYTAIPADITLVATELAVNALNENVGNYKSERVGDWAVTYADTAKTLSSDSQQILANYRRLSRSI